MINLLCIAAVKRHLRVQQGSSKGIAAISI